MRIYAVGLGCSNMMAKYIVAHKSDVERHANVVHWPDLLLRARPIGPPPIWVDLWTLRGDRRPVDLTSSLSSCHFTTCHHKCVSYRELPRARHVSNLRGAGHASPKSSLSAG